MNISVKSEYALKAVFDLASQYLVTQGAAMTPIKIADIAKRDGITVEKARDDLLKEKQPMRQFSTPEQLGALTVFLCSEAGATMTGTALPMDGGWTAH